MQSNVCSRMYAVGLLIINYHFFCEDKTNCILFSKDKNLFELNPLSASVVLISQIANQLTGFYMRSTLALNELNIAYFNCKIKQYRMVEYFDCCFDANLSGESMAMKSPRKINAKLEFYRQNEFLNSKLCKLLC